MIIGHEKQLAQLEEDFQSGNFFHAYLFVGADHLGKVTVARHLAKKLQGEHFKLDTIEILGREGSLKIADVRKVIDKVNMTKQANYKIVIIQNIDRLTVPAANSFLKTLEEPPEGTVFFLTTANLGSVLPTIISRVRMVNFYPVPGHGRPGVNLRLKEDPELFRKYQELQKDVERMMGERSVVDRFSYVEALAKDEKVEIKNFLAELINYHRQKLLSADGDQQVLAKKLSKIEEAGMLLGQNVNARLVLENLMLEL